MTGMGLTYIHAGLRACSWAVRQMTSYDIVEVSLSGHSLGSWLQKIDCLHNGKKYGTSCGSLSAWLPRLPRVTRKGQQKQEKESSSKLHGGHQGWPCVSRESGGFRKDSKQMGIYGRVKWGRSKSRQKMFGKLQG